MLAKNPLAEDLPFINKAQYVVQSCAQNLNKRG